MMALITAERNNQQKSKVLLKIMFASAISSVSYKKHQRAPSTLRKI